MGLVGCRAALLLGGAAFILSTGMQGVRAQDATDQTGEQVVNQDEKKGRVTALDRLVVGAGVDKVAIDTPQSVTVIDQSEIDSDQATEITDLVKNVAGVNATGGASAFGQGFNVRGIGGSETAGEEGRIIINVDGVNKYFEQYRMGGLFTDPELYKQVEILRGPASSTLYGSGALGGVINFTTKDASDFLTGDLNTVLRIKGSYATNSDSALGASILAHRFNDNAEILLAGNYRTGGNYTTGDGTEVTGLELDSPNGLAKGTFTFGENMEQQIRLSYQQYTATATDQEFNQINGGSSSFGDLDKRVVTDKTAIIAYQNEASDNPWLDLNIQTSYSDTYNEQTQDGGSSFYNSDYGYETYQFNVDNTFEHIGDNFENFLTIGNQTAYQKRTRDGSDSSSHAEGTDFQSGFFVQNEFIWDERLTIITGTRLDYQNLSPQENSVIPAGTPDKDHIGFSPKIAALYKITDDFAVFGSIAHTERLPTLDEVYDSSGGNTGFHLDLEPEKSNNYEIGFAASAYDLISDGDALQFKTTGFYNDVTNLIESNFGSIPRYTNVGNAEIYGVEIELFYDSDPFYLNAGYSHVRGKNKDTGGYLNTVAPDELALTVGHKMPEKGIDFGWTSRIVAAQNQTDTRATTAAFDVHDVFINWIPVDGMLVGWEARFRVDNIFNEQFQEYLEGYPAEGRSFKFTLARQFGWS
ncbi:TonB-dependent receptor [Hoeflea sp. TYP-13]|uniref:TonB-dependent receptor domain-containing protein n=1 Tax=Hoeflea sp. TYP-13 TaxID=3230023 RepID=UPI0034C65608